MEWVRKWRGSGEELEGSWRGVGEELERNGRGVGAGHCKKRVVFGDFFRLRTLRLAKIMIHKPHKFNYLLLKSASIMLIL